jgi:transcription elongation factor
MPAPHLYKAPPFGVQGPPTPGVAGPARPAAAGATLEVAGLSGGRPATPLFDAAAAAAVAGDCCWGMKGWAWGVRSCTQAHSHRGVSVLAG